VIVKYALSKDNGEEWAVLICRAGSSRSGAKCVVTLCSIPGRNLLLRLEEEVDMKWLSCAVLSAVMLCVSAKGVEQEEMRADAGGSPVEFSAPEKSLLSRVGVDDRLFREGEGQGAVRVSAEDVPELHAQITAAETRSASEDREAVRTLRVAFERRCRAAGISVLVTPEARRKFVEKAEEVIRNEMCSFEIRGTVECEGGASVDDVAVVALRRIRSFSSPTSEFPVDVVKESREWHVRVEKAHGVIVVFRKQGFLDETIVESCGRGDAVVKPYKVVLRRDRGFRRAALDPSLLVLKPDGAISGLLLNRSGWAERGRVVRLQTNGVGDSEGGPVLQIGSVSRTAEGKIAVSDVQKWSSVPSEVELRVSPGDGCGVGVGGFADGLPIRDALAKIKLPKDVAELPTSVRVTSDALKRTPILVVATESDWWLIVVVDVSADLRKGEVSASVIPVCVSAAGDVKD
jgi:hypothetical protein